MCVFVYVFNSVCACVSVRSCPRCEGRCEALQILCLLHLNNACLQTNHVHGAINAQQSASTAEAGKGVGAKAEAEASSALVPCCHGQCFSLCLCLHGVHGAD